MLQACNARTDLLEYACVLADCIEHQEYDEARFNLERILVLATEANLSIVASAAGRASCALSAGAPTGALGAELFALADALEACS
jgi:hypothetical protein